MFPFYFDLISRNFIKATITLLVEMKGFVIHNTRVIDAKIYSYIVFRMAIIMDDMETCCKLIFYVLKRIENFTTTENIVFF